MFINRVTVYTLVAAPSSMVGYVIAKQYKKDGWYCWTPRHPPLFYDVMRRHFVLLFFSFLFFLNDGVSSFAFFVAAPKISLRRSRVRNVTVAFAFFAVYSRRKLCARTVKCCIVNRRAVHVVRVGFVAPFRAELQPRECAFLIARRHKNRFQFNNAVAVTSSSPSSRRSYNIIYLIFNR